MKLLAVFHLLLLALLFSVGACEEDAPCSSCGGLNREGETSAGPSDSHPPTSSSFHSSKQYTLESILEKERLFVEKRAAELKAADPTFATIEHVNGKIYRYVAPELVELSGGTFLMGTRTPVIKADRERQREVTVEPFSIDKYEVSVGQYAAFQRVTGYVSETEKYDWSFVLHQHLSPKEQERTTAWAQATPWWAQVFGANWAHPEGPDSDVWAPVMRPFSAPMGFVIEDGDFDGEVFAEHRLDEPVVHVTWTDAMEFCAWRGLTLPTEAQWEFAGRGGKVERIYPWGNVLTPRGEHRANIWQGNFPDENFAEDGYVALSPIYSFQPNNYGLYNMIGNAWEWTVEPFDANHGDMLKKGGSSLCHESYCDRYRLAARSGNTPDSSASNLGFRCVSRSVKDEL